MNAEERPDTELPVQQVISNLRGQLAEAEEILQAISEHKVDAFVIGVGREERIYTLTGTDHAYQVILETINEGAATISHDGIIFYCNPAFATLLQMPIQQLIGSSLLNFIKAEELPQYTALIEQGLVEGSKGELSFQTGAVTFVP